MPARTANSHALLASARSALSSLSDRSRVVPPDEKIAKVRSAWVLKPLPARTKCGFDPGPSRGSSAENVTGGLRKPARHDFPGPSFPASPSLLAKSVDGARAGKRHQVDFARLAGLEAHRRAGGNIEPHAARFLAVEFQRRIGLEEMIVRADLDRPVAACSRPKASRLAAFVELDLAVLDEHSPGIIRISVSPSASIGSARAP